MNTWLDLLAVGMVCFTAILCAAMISGPQSTDKDDDKPAK